MTKKQNKSLTDYRNKVQTKRINLVLPMEMVEWICKEMNERNLPSFTATIIELLKHAKENIEND